MVTFSPVFREYAAVNMFGAAGQKRVSSRFLKDTRQLLPSFAEQKRIAAYLDARCVAIDAAAAAKRRQLETLVDVRNSLIEAAIRRGIGPHAPMRRVDQDWTNAQIDTLLAYCKSLIHECVTGQRRVSEEDIQRVSKSPLVELEQLAETRG